MGKSAPHKEAMKTLAATSRTFYIPISRLVPGLQEAVASAYLCMRAIDEIEDDPRLPASDKIKLLRQVAVFLRSADLDPQEADAIFADYQKSLPKVTLKLANWAHYCPDSIAPTVWAATAEMAEGMARWVERNWVIETEQDLDDYTYCVAGAVGVLLSDIWNWYDGTETDYVEAAGFGRGLQTVNIVRNRKEDLERGVDFFPEGWQMEDMFAYTRRNLQLGQAYIEDLKPGPVLDFCRIPLALASGTLEALAAGKSKLSRTSVLEIVQRLQSS